MTENSLKLINQQKERAFLVGVEIKNEPSLLSISDSLEELALLADTAGLKVVGETSQKLDRPHVNTYIGSGKVDEIIALAEETLADVVIFDNELTPRHLRELSLRLGKSVRVLDRTALILDIFALHANTREGRLQVELAQHEYRLPRLSHAWGHLERQAARIRPVGQCRRSRPARTRRNTIGKVDKRELSDPNRLFKKRNRKSIRPP